MIYLLDSVYYNYYIINQWKLVYLGNNIYLVYWFNHKLFNSDISNICEVFDNFHMLNTIHEARKMKKLNISIFINKCTCMQQWFEIDLRFDLINFILKLQTKDGNSDVKHGRTWERGWCTELPDQALPG